ncbi:MAG: tRNA threonylcarbamoyladenosine dehydratase [Bacteroidales bacterium]|jgi:tRNA A37 threonylcarbamoyladenosine dehydratase|nr:tRNA threonylcarbamoyladenosine dehydratase [Bacteroidales bacterium]
MSYVNSEWLSRTHLLFGEEKLGKLINSSVIVVGLGGVGGCVAEMLCRAGVGKLTIVDGDVVSESNRNRQLPALSSTLGRSKAEVVAERLRDINPDVELCVIDEFIRDERMIEILKQEKYDYVVDAIDTLSPKVFLIYHSFNLGLPIVSSMGAGGKLDPTLITVSDISKSYNDKLARAVRKKLNQLGVRKGVKVVFSPELVSSDAVILEESTNKKSNVGTVSYMPPAFGLSCASVVIRDITSK